MRRSLPLLSSALLVVALASGSLALAAAPAWAHTRLVASTPEQATPAEAPREVELVFSDPVQPGLSAVSVTGADGREQSSGAPAAGAAAASVSQSLREPLAPGTYRVAYRVLAADGHPVTGSFEITAVAGPAAATAATPSALPADPPSTPALQASAGVDDEDGSPPVLPLAVGGLVVAGAAGLLARRSGGAPSA